MRHFLLICLLLTLCLGVRALAQRPGAADSLLRLLSTAKEDENKVLLLIRIGQAFENADLEKSKSYYRQARNLGHKIRYLLTEVKFISNYTFALNMQGRFDSSLFWNLKGIEAAKKLNDGEHLAKAFFNTGTSYQYLADYRSAVNYYQQGLALFEKLNKEAYMAQANDILQVLYTAMKQYDKARNYGKKAVAQFRNLNDPKLLAYALSNLGVVYGNSNQKDSSLIYHLQAEKIARSIGDQVLLATIDLNIADVYLWKKRFEEAKTYFDSALQLARKNQISESECAALRGLSYYFMYTGVTEKSLGLAREALACSEQHRLVSEKVLILEQLASLAYLYKDSWKAATYKTESKALRDSLLNEEILRTTINTEKRFELSKKNAQLALQRVSIQRKNLFNWLLLGGLLSLMMMGLLGYRNYSHRKKMQEQRIKELEIEKQLLATQSLLRGQEEERSRIAKDLHDGLGGLLSGVKLQLGAMKGNLILTEEDGLAFNRVLINLEDSIGEMRRVAHNMMPEALLKFGLQQAVRDYSDGLSRGQNFTIQCAFLGMEQRLDNTTEVVIYRIVQELINNAVKHSGASAIFVQLMRHDEAHLNITVEDDGQGFDPKAIKEHSAGLRNITSRVKYLNGKMDIRSEPGTGTSVFIECEINAHG
ncbi:tetratricopeptide repeat-containing sensor histidine kinase [Niabella insulamsoli]|uniref:tetratricopeptide repeat-containing sensor histidine kinase n=1 Tax=Niabella insulamsoli TaxID=3144874 RepID=UPI0031FDA5F4